MTGRFWREAATLIIIGRNSQTKVKVNSVQPSDYNLLFLKRSQKSSFMPSAFVYPGGVTEASDFSLDWLQVFKKCGYSVDDLTKQFRLTAPLPEFYANKPPDILLPEIGFRIAAIRETFEECGLLLTSHMSSDTYSEIDMKSWSKDVHDDSSKFFSLFSELGGCPAIWDLHEWSGWLTPSDMSKRFDTAFYITFVDEISDVVADKTEIAHVQVSTPESILEQWQNGELWLPPPQAYEVSRFLQFKRYRDLREFAIVRGKKGLERWCPVRINATDGVLTVLPGDDLYPVNSDHTENVDQYSVDSTLEELRKASSNMHRGEITSMQDITFIANVTPKYDHLLPLNFKDVNKDSKL